jgi:hypothetical protein
MTTRRLDLWTFARRTPPPRAAVSLLLGATLLGCSVFYGAPLGVHAATGTIIADFGRGTQTPIPAGMFGAGYSPFGSQQATTETSLNQAGLYQQRLEASLSKIFAVQGRPDWSSLDSTLSQIPTGTALILTIDYTPPWLVPTNSACSAAGVPTSVWAPSDFTAWGNLGVQVLDHVQATFPGIVADLEVWNEPDGRYFFCAGDDSDAARLSAYLSLYKTVAPMLQNEIHAKTWSIRVGGPALAVPWRDAQEWFSALLGPGAGTAPYVQFVSYHHYLPAWKPVTWDGTGGTLSLLSLTQDPQYGFFPVYNLVASVVHSGSQPNAASTPIYIDEYNTNTGAPDCCRNDPTYAPLWNSLVVSDLLNASLSSAVTPPKKILYFDDVQANGYCLFGNIDPAMDCLYADGTTPVAYPQYYAYELISSPTHLNVSAGGYVENATLPAPLLGSAFAVGTAYDLLIINPSNTTYSETVQFTNLPTGIITATGYVLNAQNPQISRSTQTFSANTSGYTMTISVPALSTVAITLGG